MLELMLNEVVSGARIIVVGVGGAVCLTTVKG